MRCAIIDNSDIDLSNRSGVEDWGPSDVALAGFGCTSIISETVPAAIAAFAIAGTNSDQPTP